MIDNQAVLSIFGIKNIHGMIGIEVGGKSLLRMSFYIHHNCLDQLDMIWYDNDDDEIDENLDDRNHLHMKKFWRNYVPGSKIDYIFGP